MIIELALGAEGASLIRSYAIRLRDTVFAVPTSEGVQRI
jgi:hypothetical protein